MTTTTTDRTYKGYTNYETWNVKLWLDNEQSDYLHWMERAEYWRDEPSTTDCWSQKQSAKFNLANELKEWVEEQNPLGDQASVYIDLLGAAISEVNWQEIAEELLSEEG